MIGAILAVVFAAQDPAAAAPPAPPAAPDVRAAAAAPARPDPKRPKSDVVCEEQPVLGSRLSTHRVCHTRAQKEQQNRDAQDQVRTLQNQNSFSLTN
jgi:hypothetical protein